MLLMVDQLQGCDYSASKYEVPYFCPTPDDLNALRWLAEMNRSNSDRYVVRCEACFRRSLFLHVPGLSMHFFPYACVCVCICVACAV